MHSQTPPNRLALYLQSVLGMDGFVALCEGLGGTRLYIAWTMRDGSDLVETIGRELADKLSRAMAPATIRVPLARRERALYWRAKGLSDARIARKLGMTENGVAKLFGREDHLPERPGRGKEPTQIALL